MAYDVEYEKAQMKAAMSQANPLDPWRDSSGKITDFGGGPVYRPERMPFQAGMSGGLAGQTIANAQIANAQPAVSSRDLIEIQRALMELICTVNGMLSRTGGR